MRQLTWLRGLTALLMGVVLHGCGDSSTPVSLRSTPVNQEPVWVNGDFESGASGAVPPGWTLTTYINGGVSGTASAPPASLASLNLGSAGAGVAETFLVAGAAGTMTDPDLGSGQSFRYPFFGSQAARVNYKNSTANDGNNKNANLMQQSQVITANDVDPADGQIHVRFVIAPVLENPAHSFSQQPYYYVELLNVTRNTSLYTEFNFAGATGGPIPWKTSTSVVTGNSVQWLNWKLVNIAPASSALAIGDQVRLNVVASGCALGGHYGRIYVDGISSVVPGVYVQAVGPTNVTANSNIVYTMNFANGGAGNAAGTHVDMVLPPNTTFGSTSLGSACSAPTTANGNTLSCLIGTLSPGAAGSFTVTLLVNSNATGSVINGNYGITAANQQALLGPTVTTPIPAVGINADVVVTQVASTTAARPGTVFSASSPLFTITVTNKSTTKQLYNNSHNKGNAPTLSDSISSLFSSHTWSCAVTAQGLNSSGTASNATQCKYNNASTSGTGNISIKPTLGYNGGQITIKIYGTLSSSASGTLSNTVSSTAGSGVTDPDLSNNSSTLSVAIGTVQNLALTKIGTPSSGSVSSSPSGISCGASCTAQNANFISNTSTSLFASPVAGAQFVGWGGDCSASNASNQCTLSLAANANVTANFAVLSPGAAANLYVYQGDKQSTGLSTAFGTPLSVLVTDASGIPVPNKTVSFAALGSNANATLSANSNVTNASGIATIWATANPNSGSYLVRASETGLTPVTFALTNVGSPNSLVYLGGGSVTDPQSTPTTTAFGAPLLVEVLDRAGNPVPSATVNFAVVRASGGASATLSSATAITDSSGQASVTANANNIVGNYTATASLSSGAQVTFQLQNISSDANKIYTVSGSSQTTATGVGFGAQLVAVVTDSGGNAVANHAVAFAAPTSGASASVVVTNPNTDSLGQVYATATANSIAGPYTVTASITGLVGASAAVFNLINDGGFSLDVQQGTPQSATVGAIYGTTLQVALSDINGNPVANQNVTFKAPVSGASVTMAGGAGCGATCVIVTDSSGLATVTATANTSAGQFDVYASNPNAADPGDFTLTNLGGAATRITATSGTPQTTATGTAFALPLLATVFDSYSNAVQNANVAFAVQPANAAVTLSAATGVTDSAGQVSITATAGSQPGTYLVAATTSGAAASGNFLLTNACTQDSQCGASYWCNTGACAPTLNNNITIPSVPGHSPTLNGNCTSAAAAAVCTSAVCDVADAKCGHAAGAGPCLSGNANVVCRTGLCSAAGVCRTAGTCLADGDCAASRWCSIDTQACVAKFGNSTPMPADSGHVSPVLDGSCSVAAAALVCASGVCDGDSACGYANGDGTCSANMADPVCRSGICGSDGVCGLANGDGTCDSTTAATLCRSGTCSNTNVCAAPATCTQDTDCPSPQWCSLYTGRCRSPAANGDVMPTDPSHGSPALDGNCSVLAAKLVCASQVCDPTDNRCGFANTDGACDASNANTVCRSMSCGSDGMCGLGVGDTTCSSTTASIVCRTATCSIDGACMPVGGCNTDGDCTGSDWCLVHTGTCTAQLVNGALMPLDANHLSPVLDGNCSAAAAAVVCASGVCDSDNGCGYANNSNACSAANANVICRSGVCGSTGSCGLATGDAGAPQTTRTSFASLPSVA